MSWESHGFSRAERQVVYVSYSIEQIVHTLRVEKANQLYQLTETLEQYNIKQLENRVRELEDLLSTAELFEITFYTEYCGTGAGLTASGTVPVAGRTIAVDRRIIALGSRVWVQGYGVFTAEDVGGAVRGNVVDIYINGGVQDALQLGRQKRKVVVLSN